MDVFALFTDGTAEKIIIDSFPNREGEKGLIVRTTISSYDLRESAVSSVKNTHILLEKYLKDLPDVITVCIYGFSNKVLGNSADLSFSLAFAAHLIEKKKITVNKPIPSTIAATGMIDERLGVRSIKGLKEKILAAIEKKAELMFFPEENLKDFEEMRQTDPEFNELIKKINIVPVKSLEEVLFKLGIIEQIQTSNALNKPGKTKIFAISASTLFVIILLSLYLAFRGNFSGNRDFSVLSAFSPAVTQNVSPTITVTNPPSTQIGVTPLNTVSTQTPVLSTTAKPVTTPSKIIIYTSVPRKTTGSAQETINFSGNSISNITNTGFASIQGGWIYYCNNKDVGLYKSRPDGSGKITLNNDFASYINVNGNYIFYINKKNDSLYKVKIDGGNPRKLNDDDFGSIDVVGDWIYYICLDDNKIYKVDKNGLDRTPLCNNFVDDLVLPDSKFNCKNLNICNNRIYFYAEFIKDSKKNGIYKMNLDGSSIYCVSNEKCNSFSVENGCLYFISSNDGYLYKMDLNGNGKEKISSDSMISFNVSSGWIFYSNYTGLYKMNADGGYSLKLSDDYSDKINVVGDWIYYYNPNDSNRLYKLGINGNERQRVD